MLKARHLAEGISSTVDDLRFALYTVVMDDVHRQHVSKKLDQLLTDATNISKLFNRTCKYWRNGHCKFGDKCVFKHDSIEQSSPAPTIRSDVNVNTRHLQHLHFNNPKSSQSQPNPAPTSKISTLSTAYTPCIAPTNNKTKKKKNKRQRRKARKEKEKQEETERLHLCMKETNSV